MQLDATADGYGIDKDQLVEEAVFGKQVENFLNSKLGIYLVKYAESKANDATEKLKGVYSWRRRRIQELQNEVHLWESFQQRLAEAIMDGQQALKLLDER